MSVHLGGEALNRRLARAVLIAAGVVAVTAVAVAYLWLRRPAPEAGAPARRDAGNTLAYISNASGEGVDLYLADPAGGNPIRLTESVLDESWPAWSPDGRHLAFVRASTEDAQLASGEKEGLYLLSWEGGAPREMLLAPAREAGIGGPFWSPDSRQVGVIGQPPAGDGRLGGGPVLTLCEATSGDCQSRELDIEANLLETGTIPAWTTDGRAIIFSGPNLAQTRGGALTPLRLELATRELTQLAISGQYAAVSSRATVAYIGVPPDAQQIWMVSATGGVRQRIGRPLASALWCYGLAWAPDGRRLASAESDGEHTLLVIRTPEDGEVAEYVSPLQGRQVPLSPTWSPDGRYVSYTVLTGLESSVPDGTLVVVDTETDAVSAWPAEPGVLQAFGAWRPAGD